MTNRAESPAMAAETDAIVAAQGDQAPTGMRVDLSGWLERDRA